MLSSHIQSLYLFKSKCAQLATDRPKFVSLDLLWQSDTLIEDQDEKMAADKERSRSAVAPNRSSCVSGKWPPKLKKTN